MIGIPGWMLITAAVFYVSLNACCLYDWVCMRTFPKMTVYEIPRARSGLGCEQENEHCQKHLARQAAGGMK